MEIFNDLISIKEACSYIGVKENTIRWHIAQGTFKKGVDCRKYGSTWVFKKESLRRIFKDMPLGIIRGEYTKENYPEMIEPKDINENSNLVGYIPADADLEYCPRLIIDSNVVLGFFRGYHIENLNKKSDCVIKPSNEDSLKGLKTSKKDPSKSINEFKTISDAVNFLLKSSGLEERYFSENELEVIRRWYVDSKDIYSYYWDGVPRLIME